MGLTSFHGSAKTMEALNAAWKRSIHPSSPLVPHNRPGLRPRGNALASDSVSEPPLEILRKVQATSKADGYRCSISTLRRSTRTGPMAIASLLLRRGPMAVGVNLVGCFVIV